MHVAALYRYSTRRDTQVRGDRARGHDRLSRGTYSVSSLPEALPCHKYDDFYTHQADVWGNVIVRDEAEFQRWAAYCRPSSREEALENGGCVIFRPAPSKEKLAVPEETQYFYITAVDDVVYGRAAYVSADTASSSGVSAGEHEGPVVWLTWMRRRRRGGMSRRVLLMRASATVLNNMLWTTVPSIFFFSFLRGTFLCVELNPCLSLPLIKAHKSYALFSSFVCFVSISLHTWSDAAYLLILLFFFSCGLMVFYRWQCRRLVVKMAGNNVYNLTHPSAAVYLLPFFFFFRFCQKKKKTEFVVLVSVTPFFRLCFFFFLSLLFLQHWVDSTAALFIKLIIRT